MRVKTGKAVSKILGIWVFFLLLILKGAFPKAAFAQSTNRCALSPECLAVIKESAGSAIAAPTGAGFGASTLSTTTATGATSSSVQAVANFTVVDRLGAVAIWHYWNQAYNEWAQEKAKQRYCTANPGDSVCGFPWKVTGPGLASGMPNCQLSSTFYPRILYATSISFSSSTFTDGPFKGCPKDIAVLDGQLSPDNFFVGGTGTITRLFAWKVTGPGLASGMPNCQLSGAFYPRILYGTSISFSSSTFTDGPFEGCPKDIVVLDGQLSPDNFFVGGTGTITNISYPLQWKDWPQAKRDAAVALLNNSDWQGFITSMPKGGALEPTERIHAPGEIVIPGQETDDPSTPADERLLRREPGFFTWPGLPDFDYDGDPDWSDPDDDDDGTPDSFDPDPQNPVVPQASSGPSSPSPTPSPTPSPGPSPSVPGPGVGGNGTASEFGDMSGISRADADAFLRSRGATVKTTAGGYTQYKFPDKSEVWIRPDGEVVRTPAPKYGPDGSRINRGLRLNKDGSLLTTQDEFGNQIPGTHSTGEMVSN